MGFLTLCTCRDGPTPEPLTAGQPPREFVVESVEGTRTRKMRYLFCATCDRCYHPATAPNRGIVGADGEYTDGR